MPKYMLTRGQKKQPLCTRVDDVTDSGIRVKRKAEWVFEPMKVQDTGDVSMQDWVDTGYLVEVFDRNKELDGMINDASILGSDVIGAAELDVSSETTVIGDGTLDDAYNVGTEMTVDVSNSVQVEEPGGGIDEASVMWKEADEGTGVDVDEDTMKYKKSDDGKFVCLICGKKLKLEVRMISHVESKH